MEWFDLLGVVAVPVLYRGVYSDAVIDRLIAGLDTARQEGIVVRTAGTFGFDAFARHVAKWVRPGHVQTDTHWMQAEIVPNGLVT